MTTASSAIALQGTAVDPQARLAEIGRLARALSGAKQRINNPKMPGDACYAGIGYDLPEPPMLAATTLYEALGPLPDGKSLDRVDPNGNYALGNIRYATPAEQTANRRPLVGRAASDEDWYDD
jgi:hypothetical protein